MLAISSYMRPHFRCQTYTSDAQPNPFFQHHNYELHVDTNACRYPTLRNGSSSLLSVRCLLARQCSYTHT